MTRKPQNSRIACAYFSWRLFQRGRVFYGDARSGKYRLGKHSLGTKDYDEALCRLRQLDYQKAIELGLAEVAIAVATYDTSISAGWQKFDDFCSRSPVLGGVSANTRKRYRAVRTKHQKFCARHRIANWADFDKSALEKYGNFLSTKYADRTVFLEVTLLKSVAKWLVEEGHLSAGRELKYPLRRPQGTDTYCYRPIEVSTMIEHCRSTAGLTWLANVIVALVHSGLRIGELVGLRWTDINLDQNLLRVPDERSSHRKRKAGTDRTTKSRHSRAIPLHKELKRLLLTLDRKPDGYVFHAARGGRLHPRNVLQTFIDSVIEPLKETFPTAEGEVGFEHGRLHGLRHYFCTQCFISGASAGDIQSWLGHASSRMTEYYRHLRSEDAQREMGRIDFLGRPHERSGDVA